MERVKNILLVAVVLALVAPTMAADYAGLGGHFVSNTSDVWNAPANWDDTWEDHENGSYTGQWDLIAGDSYWLLNGGGHGTLVPTMPVITAGMDTIGGNARISANFVVTQTGGKHTFANGTGWKTSFVIHQNAHWSGVSAYNGSGQWNISGGELLVYGNIWLGYRDASSVMTLATDGEERINISGDGIVSLLANTYTNYGLSIADGGAAITIADQGKFVVDSTEGARNLIDQLMAANKIVGINGTLQAVNDGTFYTVSIIPEPATMALLGLGAVALLRRKR